MPVHRLFNEKKINAVHWYSYPMVKCLLYIHYKIIAILVYKSQIFSELELEKKFDFPTVIEPNRHRFPVDSFNLNLFAKNSHFLVTFSIWKKEMYGVRSIHILSFPFLVFIAVILIFHPISWEKCKISEFASNWR